LAPQSCDLTTGRRCWGNPGPPGNVHHGPRAWPPRGSGLGCAGEPRFRVCVECIVPTSSLVREPHHGAHGLHPWHVAGCVRISSCCSSHCYYHCYCSTERSAGSRVFSCHHSGGGQGHQRCSILGALALPRPALRRGQWKPGRVRGSGTGWRAEPCPPAWLARRGPRC